jgi:hypothetical protein
MVSAVVLVAAALALGLALSDGSWWRFWALVGVAVAVLGLWARHNSAAIVGLVGAVAVTLTGLVMGAHQAMPAVDLGVDNWALAIAAIWSAVALAMLGKRLFVSSAAAATISAVHVLFWLLYPIPALRVVNELMFLIYLAPSAGGGVGRILRSSSVRAGDRRRYLRGGHAGARSQIGAQTIVGSGEKDLQG